MHRFPLKNKNFLECSKIFLIHSINLSAQKANLSKIIYQI
ncbi:hypothetical protein CAMRE0001_0939 [Campylobacter rectus RM3267]|uniref:Uncharacterized protein n=1 Tax=Campylobacter rectus RM3267 TaxID=553218 RepID=B9D2K5_CAMRE|nr:hypothetical protein CAMRE0001_0939 [Campylobacter rectus RM3267]